MLDWNEALEVEHRQRQVLLNPPTRRSERGVDMALFRGIATGRYDMLLRFRLIASACSIWAVSPGLTVGAMFTSSIPRLITRTAPT